MRLLLDTHTLLWYFLTDPKMTQTALTLVEDPANTVLVSPASYWELAIKLGTGKYSLTVPFATFIQEAIFDNGFTVLPIEPRHVERILSLPAHHGDPFDRLLVAQALVEDIEIVGADVVFDAYGVRRLW